MPLTTSAKQSAEVVVLQKVPHMITLVGFLVVIGSLLGGFTMAGAPFPVLLALGFPAEPGLV